MFIWNIHDFSQSPNRNVFDNIIYTYFNKFHPKLLLFILLFCRYKRQESECTKTILSNTKFYQQVTKNMCVISHRVVLQIFMHAILPYNKTVSITTPYTFHLSFKQLNQSGLLHYKLYRLCGPLKITDLNTFSRFFYGSSNPNITEVTLF